MVASTYIPARPGRGHVARRRLPAALSQLLLAVASAAPAATIVVNDAADLSTVDCTLRDAIVSANTDSATAGCVAGSGIDTIVFEPTLLPMTITLSGSPLTISSSLAVKGPGAENLVISGDDRSGIFRIDDGSSDEMVVALSGMTLSDGNADSGGAVFNFEQLTLRDSVVTANSATRGGGVSNRRSLTMSNTTISDNQAERGAGIFNLGPVLDVSKSALIANTASGQGGGLFNYWYADVRNSTFSGNTAQAGGAIFNYIYTNLAVQHVTITANSSTSGGGLYNTGSDFEYFGTLRVDNSIIVGNTGGDCLNQPAGVILSNVSNMIGDGGCATDAVDPLPGPARLGPLLQPPTGAPFHPLQSLSAAIDTADAQICGDFADDQTGLPRPIDGTAAGEGRCDVGAVEFLDVYGPSATLLALSDVTEPGVTTVTAVVQFVDDAPVDLGSLTVGDVVAVGAGYHVPAVAVSLEPDASRVVYSLTPAGGFWRDDHNGDYTLMLQADEVLDTATTGSNATESMALGTFQVTVPSNEAPSVTGESWTIRSTTPVGEVVGSVQYDDPDGNVAAQGAITITSGNDDGVFAINDQGEIRIAAPFPPVDAEHALTVRVEDDRGLAGTGEIHVRIEETIFRGGFQ